MPFGGSQELVASSQRAANYPKYLLALVSFPMIFHR
jgi:hypothetical protein